MRDRPRWWSYVVHIVQDYPQLHNELEAMRSTSMIANYSGMPKGGGGPSDPVASAAFRTLPRQDQKEHDAVEAALAWARTMPNGRQRVKLISMVYFKRTHTLDDASIDVGYAYGHANRLNRQFIRKVAFYMGLIDEDVAQ